jgi:hypothetical protein
LEAVKLAVLCTLGDITVVIDNASIIKGIRRGPAFKHSSNQHAWKIFWECVGSRTVTPLKIKSHSEEAEAARQVVEHLHLLANSKADALAEGAAVSAQLPLEDIEAVRFADKRAFQVQEHLRVVALSVAQSADRLYRPSSRLERAAEARTRAAAKKDRREALLATTEHRWCEDRGRCLACLRAPTRDVPKDSFLATPCLKRPFQIHASHDLRNHRGLWYCKVSGATGSKRFTTRGLGGECQPPTEGRLRTLTRLQAGDLPYGHRAWPDEAEEERTGLELVG